MCTILTISVSLRQANRPTPDYRGFMQVVSIGMRFAMHYCTTTRWTSLSYTQRRVAVRVRRFSLNQLSTSTTAHRSACARTGKLFQIGLSSHGLLPPTRAPHSRGVPAVVIVPQSRDRDAF